MSEKQILEKPDVFARKLYEFLKQEKKDIDPYSCKLVADLIRRFRVVAVQSHNAEYFEDNIFIIE